MSDIISRLVTRRARLVLGLAALTVVVGAILGVGTFSRLQAGGFDDPTTESARAATIVREQLHLDAANLVLLVTAPAGSSVDDQTVSRVARAAADRLDGERDVRVLADYWRPGTTPASSLRSEDGGRALVVAHLEGDEDDFRTRMADLEPAYTRIESGVQTQTGGFVQAIADITNQVKRDLTLAEALAVPIVLVLLVLFLGSVTAGVLPLMVGVIAMIGTFAILRIAVAFTDVSIFSLNLTIALGLGLGIDYGLLIVNRFRDELELGRDIEAALDITVRTAGRTVAYSAATVAVALAALLAFPVYFLRSFAYAGISVVAVTAVAAVLVLPAMMRLLGQRVAHRRFGGSWSGIAATRRWERLVAAVMRRPLLNLVPALALLAILALPFSSVAFGLPDDRALPAGVSQARTVADVMRTEFTGPGTQPLVVVFPDSHSVSDGSLSSYAVTLSLLPHVMQVDSPTGAYAAGRWIAPGRTDLRTSAVALEVHFDGQAYGESAQDLVAAVRSTTAPGGALVGGATARFVDVNTTIGSRLPIVGGLIALTTFLLIFSFTGSIVLPLKAILLNIATMSAVLGAMVWVFQEGHGASLLGFTAMPLSVSIPPLMFCLAFGLSMDYTVFLLGRITEEHRNGADDATAVVRGLGRAGPIVTAAAVLMSATFLAFTSSKVSFIQMLGLGCALAVLLDATVVRGLMVPALMRLLGGANWWAPRPLQLLHARYGIGIRESGSPVALRHKENS